MFPVLCIAVNCPFLLGLTSLHLPRLLLGQVVLVKLTPPHSLWLCRPGTVFANTFAGIHGKLHYHGMAGRWQVHEY